MPIKTDRSRVEVYQRCPRSRWLQYEKRIKDSALAGYQPDKPAFALEIGSGFHKGMEIILGGLIKNPTLLTGTTPLNLCESYLEEGVKAGVAEYDSNILPYFDSYQDRRFDISGQDGGDGEVEDEQESFTPYTVAEGRALVEALIRVYCAAPAGLASLLDEYEVLEVEQEIDVPLDKCARCNGMGHLSDEIFSKDWNPRTQSFRVGATFPTECPDCKGSGGSIILMSRPDGILRSRRDHQLYVLSFKTTGKWDKRKADQGRYDTEGISQLIAAEHKFGEIFAGVQMVYDIKGYKMQDKSDGIWKTYNGITRPYMKKSPETKGWEWEERDPGMLAFARDYINEHGEPKQVTGPQGWQKVNLWEYGPDAIKLWVEYMAAGQWPTELHGNVDMLDKMILMPPPFYRDQESIEEWKRSTIFQESRVAWTAKFINGLLNGEPAAEAAVQMEMPELELDLAGAAQETLDSIFPKHRHSCMYPSPCPFIPVCHEGMPVEGGMFKPRSKNHPQETE